MPGLTYERARGLRPDLSFNAAYRGEVYAQPLLWRDPKTGAGVLIVATEEDEVYAFDEKTGAQTWMRTLGDLSATRQRRVPLRRYLAARRDRHAGHRQGARDPLSRRDGHARQPCAA